MKICRNCKIEKPLDAFHNDKSRTDGKYPNCKSCHYAYACNYYLLPKVKARIKAYNQKMMKDPKFRASVKKNSEKCYNSIKGRATSLLRNARKSPSGQTKEFSITLEYIIKGLEHGKCAVTGISFQMHKDLIGRIKNPYSPSLDRIDCTKGYTIENTRLVIWWYNMAKGELSDIEMKTLCQIICKQ